ncbi:hypothetical protein WMY93_021837 [Mugilogobius chulae]|uniref:54 kDa nucleoporin n=1 Tax=Mugilogobius chulae TaxID=88201 RepID=A0AAW0NBV2_9GOBI
MAFNFGAATSNPATSTTGFSFGSFGAKTTAAPSAFGFGTTTTTAPSGFGTFTAPNFGTATTSAAAPSTGFSFGSTGTGTFGGFGTTTTTAAAPGSTFSFAAPSSTTGSLFGNTQNKGFGFSSGLGAGTTTGTSAFGTGLGATSLGGFGGFNIQPSQQPQGGLFGQQVPQPGQTQQTQLYQQVMALSAPTLLGDERDTILAKWNQLQAYWGTGKGYYANNNPPVDFTQENPFCRFKAVGYSCIPVTKDEDGLVLLVLNKKEVDVRAQQQQLVESLQKILGNNQMLSVNVEGVKSLPDDQTEVIIYVVERSPNGTSKRIPASTLFSYLEQASVKLQLTQLGVQGLWPAQSYLQHSLSSCCKMLQPIISNDISELQKNQATTVAKIAQYKRNLMDLSHRVLQILIKQEIQRKSGYAIQVDEEHLRVQLDTIQSELNAPTQFKGRLNELMSQIRMQNHFGAVRSEERYSVDADLLREIKQHLKQQQDGLSHLISVIKDDLEDIKLIEHGLSDSGHIRGGI